MNIECCKSNRKAKSWHIIPQEGYIECIMTFLKDCPVCGRSVIRLERWKMEKGQLIYNPYTLKGGDAWDLFLKLKPSIIRPFSFKENEQRANIGYNYNEYGKVKKGYSSLSVLKIGRLKPNIDRSDVKFISCLSA